MDYNCNTCFYSNHLDNGDIYCDKREFEGVTVIIDKDKAGRHCSCHSHYPIIDTRYMIDWTYTYEADDVCEICYRFLKLYDTDQYKYVEIKDDNGNVDVIRKCSICLEKGR